MKRLIAIPTVLFIFSCGSKKESSGLDQLIHTRDSLKVIYTDVSKQLRELDNQILALDTSLNSRAVKVITQTLEPQSFEHYFEVQGVVQTDQNVMVTPEFNGTIKQVKVKIGQPVKEGTILAIIDTEVIQKNINELKTALDLAKTLYEKQEKLWNQKIGSEIQYLEAKNRKESLENKMAVLKAQMEKAIITAPFTGIVDEVFQKEGEMATPMMPLLRIVNIENLYIEADISEDYLVKVKPNVKVMVEFPSLSMSLESAVSRIGQNINPGNRTFKVQLDIKNPEGILKPNLIAKVHIRDLSVDSALIAPSSIIQQDAQGKEFVFVVDESSQTAVKTEIESGLSYKNKTQIVKGLQAGKQLILKGARGIKDGQIIQF